MAGNTNVQSINCNFKHFIFEGKGYEGWRNYREFNKSANPKKNKRKDHQRARLTQEKEKRKEQN